MDCCRQFKTLGPRQNGHHFADDTFKRICLNENVRIFMKISLKFDPKSPIDKYTSIGSDNDSVLTRRKAIIWTNDGKFTDAYMHHSASMDKSSMQWYGITGPQEVNKACTHVNFMHQIGYDGVQSLHDLAICYSRKINYSHFNLDL